MLMLESLYEYSQEFIRIKNQSFRRYFLNAGNPLSERLSVLVGQRGIGKTTMLIQSLLDHVDGDLTSNKILYVQADHFILGELKLYEIAKNFQLMGGQYLALDEIHQYPDWSLELKSIWDSFPQLKIVASGSSALAIHQGSHDLSRRAIVYKILGMSFREFLSMNEGIEFPSYDWNTVLQDHTTIAREISEKLRQHQTPVLPLFQKYLKVGYYPYYNELVDPEKFQITLEKNIHTTLESDLVAIYPFLTGYGIRKIKQLFVFLAKNVPYSPNWSNLKKFLDIGDERTLKNYLHYLEEAGLISSVYKSSNQLAKQEVPEKIYLQNSNLMTAITLEPMNIGTAREVFFHSILSKDHHLTIPLNGDFLVDEQWIFEIGGRKKSHQQIKGHQSAFVASDDIEVGFQSKIPLWLLGFLY
jgi:uncharacterized protein